MSFGFERETGKKIVPDTEGERIKRVGFFGAYSYDIIMYLARILSLAGKQVLVFDRSTEQEVIRMIRSVSEGDLQLGIFHFCGVDVTSRVVLPETMNLNESYDVVIYDFGGNMCPEEYHSCDTICYVLDMYVHNALRIQETENVAEGKTWMVLRDLFRGKAMVRYHMRLTGKAVAKEDVFSIRLNSDDFVARFRMEADQLPRIEFASDEMKDMVYQMASRICPEEIGTDAKRKKNRKGRGSGSEERFSA